MDSCSEVQPCKQAHANSAKPQEQWMLLHSPQQHFATSTARRPKQVDILQKLCSNSQQQASQPSTGQLTA